MAESKNIVFSVFTKPWKMTLEELADFVAGLGFDGVELPVRPEFQVEPPNIARDLPKAARTLASRGVKICSIAGPTDETAIAACAEAGVPCIRICVPVKKDERYSEMEARVQREFDALIPALDKYGVAIGVQNHCDRQVPHAIALRDLISKYDPRHIAAVYDPAHCALDGERIDIAVDVLWERLCMVNLKNAIYRRTNGPEAATVIWKKYWTGGRHGLCAWPEVAAELKSRGYRGVVCLTAEYSDHESADRLIAEDIAYAKSLF